MNTQMSKSKLCWAGLDDQQDKGNSRAQIDKEGEEAMSENFEEHG